MLVLLIACLVWCQNQLLCIDECYAVVSKLQLGELLCLVQMNMVVFPVCTCTCISPPCSDKKTDVNWSFSMFVFVVVSPCKILSIVEVLLLVDSVRLPLINLQNLLGLLCYRHLTY